MNKNIDELVSAMSNLKDNGRIPTLNKHRRKNYKEATWRRKGNTIDWYFEYKIEIDNDNNVCLIYMKHCIKVKCMNPLIMMTI